MNRFKPKKRHYVIYITKYELTIFVNYIIEYVKKNNAKEVKDALFKILLQLDESFIDLVNYK